jgi:hypothetical protein
MIDFISNVSSNPRIGLTDCLEYARRPTLDMESFGLNFGNLFVRPQSTTTHQLYQ